MGSSLLDPLRAFRNAVATPPVPYAPRGQRSILSGILGRPASAEAQMRAMGTNGTLFSIVNTIITGYSQVDWHLYRKAQSGLKADRVEVTNHAALDLWNAPNGFMHGMAFRETVQQHEELVGEQWWVIARHPASMLPLELWPVRPDRMEPIPDPETFLAGYVYHGPNGELVPLGLDDVLFMRRPNPLDPYRGMGAVQTILVDLDASRFSREWNRNFFLSSAEPGGVLQVDKRLSDDEFDELRERWTEQHKGTAAAHRVAILENGLTWVDRKYTNRDMQFAELATASRETIREALGFPKPMTGATDDINRSNADAGEYVFAKWLLVARLRRTRALLNTRLLPMYGRTGEGLEFDYDSPVPEDEAADAAALVSKAQAAQFLVQAGAWGPDVLTTVGLPEMSFGQPDADPDRALLVDLVKGAPTLAPMILPMLGFDIPEQWRGGVPGGPQAPGASAAAEDSFAEQAAALLAGGVPDVDAAMRWVAVAHDDENTCKPCLDNDGHVYRNRAKAYADYPGGHGYVNCVGAKYGNKCRCKVVRRRGVKEEG